VFIDLSFASAFALSSVVDAFTIVPIPATNDAFALTIALCLGDFENKSINNSGYKLSAPKLYISFDLFSVNLGRVLS
jgi:hypothetical protein